MAFLKKDGGDDLVFPMDESGQGRFSHMRVLMLTGAGAASRMAEFIRSYTNRDGSNGLPSIHIGATSPYIDGGNLFYIFFQDNANDPHVESNFPATDRNGDAITYANAETTRLAAVAANEALIARLNGSDRGWKV
jgi:hypothetical protein